MKKNVYFLFLFCAATLIQFSCNDNDSNDWNGDPDDSEYVDDWDDPEIPSDSGDPGDAGLVPNPQDLSYLTDAISIIFSDGTAEIDNPFSESGVTVTETNGHVIINSSVTNTELNYILSGITEDGSVKIYGNYKFNLYLNGLGITNPKGAAINNQCGKKATVYLVDGTQNRLIDGEVYETVANEDMKGTFFSEGQLLFYGNGTLEVRGKNKHAICSDDHFIIYEGTIWVKEAASDAIHANDYIEIHGGTLTTRSTGEGLDCEKGYVEITGGDIEIVTLGQKGHGIKSKTTTTVNTTGTLTITVYGEASKGFNCSQDMEIQQGTLVINTAGDAIWDADEADTSSAAGIKCDGNLLIENGNITIISTGKGGKGINVSETLVINDGTITITTSGDQYVYDRNNDTAAKAIRAKGDLTINGGDITIRTSKTEAEGIESKAMLTITGGNLDVRAYDDCLNAGTHIQIDGGTIFCRSASNDGIDSNGTLTITGGLIVSAGTSAPEAGIDCDNSRFTITGGTIIGIGGDTSTPTASVCIQPSVIFKSSAANVKTIYIAANDGTEALTFQLPVTYSRGVVLLYSSPSLQSNTSYTIYTDGSISGGNNFYGLYTGATYTGGNSAGSFTTSSMVSTVGTSSGGMGGPGGR
ncbi:MAG: carbohydrate-binding domain-containing protein [Tannerellaceae bacterium]|nr:carbohydrate-binding domain-containing protein [Tannerellaceae bacterium]